MRNASLEVLVRRLGEPDNALLVSLGLPMGRPYRCRRASGEWLRAYMDNGPWFDENGQRSNSDAFIKELLSAHMKPTDFLPWRKQVITKKKAASSGNNYLKWTDLVLYLGHLLFYPMNWLQIVTERLQPDGPTRRLIDLERERGLDV